MYDLKSQRQDRLLKLEFKLKCEHPDVFVSYKSAKNWALEQLALNPDKYSGDYQYGWCLHVYPECAGYSCSISQSWWAADHCGQTRPTGALAIVQAMLEIQAGY